MRKNKRVVCVYIVCDKIAQRICVRVILCSFSGNLQSFNRLVFSI